MPYQIDLSRKCVNFTGTRDDGSICYSDAGDSGWCSRCSAAVFGEAEEAVADRAAP